MKQKHFNIFLRVALCLTLLIAPPFATKEAKAQFVVTDLGAAAQRIKASIVEGVNFALEIEKMAEQLLTATGNLQQATKLAQQMEGVYKTISGAIKKGRELVNLYRTIEDTWNTINAITQEYQYYAKGGALSAARVRRMNYLIRNVSDNVQDVVEYVSNTLFNDLGLSVKEKKEETEALDKTLRGNNAALRAALDEDRRDMIAYSIGQIESGMLDAMLGRPIQSISDADVLRSGIGSGIGFGDYSSKGLLTKVDWDSVSINDSDNTSDEPISTDSLPKDRLFRVVYIIEGLITILMAPIAYFRKNKGEANAQDAILKVVFGFFFAVIMTTIVQAVFFS